jgi:xanthine dehydrogenase small subunit
MHNTIRFILAGRIVEVSDCDPTQTVLEYLREAKGLTGSKEGCAEGDCGACTVVVGELHGNTVRYRSVNSCIQFLPTLDGKQLLTVEDLSEAHGPLHDVQQAMVDQHGSQCGFCTPGIVMSLFSMFHNRTEHDITKTEIELGLAGNLCRCTGYAPIVRAAKQALAQTHSDFVTVAEARTIEQLKSIKPVDTLHIKHADRQFYAPDSSSALCKLLDSNPRATMVAGATDVGLWVTKQMRELETVIYLGRVKELATVTVDEKYVRIGAVVSYSDAEQPITQHYPAFRSLIDRIGATQVRNAGTVGGNIANGSPIGDMPPGLIAAGAKLVLNSTGKQRIIDLEDFFIAYGKQDLRPGEFVEQVLLPIPDPGRLFATYKISKRIEQDISAVCAAFSVRVDNDVISDARVAYGGMAEIPKRAIGCEQALLGKPWSNQTISVAMQELATDFTPITDMRASASYRMRVAQNLLHRFYLENSGVPYPVRLGQQHEQEGANV